MEYVYSTINRQKGDNEMKFLLTASTVIRLASTGSDGTSCSQHCNGIAAKVGRSLTTKDKINSALSKSLIEQVAQRVTSYLNITLQIDLCSFICIQRILISIESTCVEPDLASVLAKCNSLDTRTECVLDIQIVSAFSRYNYCNKFQLRGSGHCFTYLKLFL